MSVMHGDMGSGGVVDGSWYMTRIREREKLTHNSLIVKYTLLKHKMDVGVTISIHV